MSLKVTIKYRPHRFARVIRVESPDVYGLAFTSEIEVDDKMLELSSIRFDHLIDDAVRKHCRQVADAMFRDWKEGRTMTNKEFLEMQAAAYIDQHEPLPIDLVMKMSAEGMDVEAIEKQLINERDRNDE